MSTKFSFIFYHLDEEPQTPASDVNASSIDFEALPLDSHNEQMKKEVAQDINDNQITENVKKDSVTTVTSELYK